MDEFEPYHKIHRQKQLDYVKEKFIEVMAGFYLTPNEALCVLTETIEFIYQEYPYLKGKSETEV